MEMKEIYSRYRECSAVSTDTRQIEEGTMFFALKGENFNGNKFAADALSKGARYAVVDEEGYKTDDRYILVKDVLETLQQLAHYHRKQLNIPVIAITGSNGKTTTKELVNMVLSKKFKTYATKGNLNNHIGIPLTLLAMKPGTEMAIVEMGANHQKEIEGYCAIVEPDFGLITNIGKAHLEGFGGLEGVKKGKGELYDYLLKNNKKVFINSSSEILMSMSKFSDPVLYSKKGDYYSAELIEASPYIRFTAENGEKITTHLLGAYNFENISAALCIGKYFGVEDVLANSAVASYNPQNNRSQVMRKGTNTIIMDAYNANPSSMKAAIENFSKVKADAKWLILGDMFELGEESISEHEKLGALINGMKFDKVVLCGKYMNHATKALPAAKYFEDKKALLQWLTDQHVSDATILLKGSRGMGLESVVEVIG
jgi:UDP-N-acetylmuramoyl-tripeptide--D-alanyl-D-alanine ligase